jgi:geranylgeranyl diphosphate synthase, type II
MYNLKELHELVSNEISSLNFKKTPVELYEPIKYILSAGGKRLRPVLSLMACNLFSEDIKNAIKPSLGIEIFHNFTLLHDDIMDNAPMRRNMQTVHSKWNNTVAILSGDAMSILSYRLIAETFQERLKEIFDIFNDTALAICEGQQYDMNFEKLSGVPVDDYLKMIELKTSVLIAASLKIGALCGGAGNTDANSLYEFGRNLGLAFQLQDDLLDVYGDSNKFGKQIGGDIVSNKKTFLLIKALELAEGEMFDRLNALIHEASVLPKAKVEEVKYIYDKLGIQDIAQDKINFFFENAMHCFDLVNVEEDRKSELKKLAFDLLKRDR